MMSKREWSETSHGFKVTGAPLGLASLAGVALFYIAIFQPASAQQTCFDGGLLVDYGDTGYSEGGAWEDVTGNYYTAGQSWTDVRRTGQDNAWAKWTVKIPGGGKFRVYFWHVPSDAPDTKIEIEHNGQTETVTRGMKYGHLGWTSLGDYDFAAGSEASVKITRGQGTLIVDSVKFLSVDKIKPPVPLPPYPKPDGSFPTIDDKGNLILNGHPYPVLYQELLEDTVAHPESIPYYDEIFDIALAQGVNTLSTCIDWRDLETAPGVYDYRVIDALIEKARARNMHLTLNLFFAWRDLQSGYIPDYINHDRATYLNIKNRDGSDANGYQVSGFADATRAAETKALQALFQRVRDKDPDHQVVILAQLENEMPSNRDYSPPALEAWKGQVPKELIDYLMANEGTVNRMIWHEWQSHGRKTAGTWEQVFGTDSTADRIFGIWCLGHNYVEPMIGDLKRVLPIPLYMNAWQHESPSSYNYLDVFHAAVPSLDAMGPDAYGDLDKWEEDVGLSYRPWLRMVIPEQHHSANTIWRAIANYNTLLSGQYYDVEGSDWLCCRETYDLINAMASLIASKRRTGDMTGFFQSRHSAGESWSEYFYDLKVTYTATVRPHTFAQFIKEVPAPCEKINNVKLGELDGCGLLISLGNGEYLITSTRIDVTLSYINGGAISVTDAQTGHFEQGKWIFEGPAKVKQEGDCVHFSFPTENRHYGQVRFKLATTASNPAEAYEAERGKLLQDAEPFYNYGASGVFGVTSLKSEGSGIEIKTNADFDAAALTIRYAWGGPSKATVYVNGKSAQDIDFPATGLDTNWAEKSIAISVPQGATLSVQADKDAPGPNIDCVMLSRDIAPDLTVKSTGSP